MDVVVSKLVLQLRRFALLIALIGVLCLQPGFTAVSNGQEVALSTHGMRNKVRADSRFYFVEFRARSADSYGHTFIIYGTLNAQGEISSGEVAGLHPATESVIPWMIGHLVWVPAETGASDGDTEDQYVTARFRVLLNETEYSKVTAFIKQLQANSPIWHAVLYNCNAFVGDVASFMGLQKPFSIMVMPAAYINSLRDLNASRSDYKSIIGIPVKVKEADALRADAIQALSRSDDNAIRMQGSDVKLRIQSP